MHELVPEPGAKYGDESRAIWDENSRVSPPPNAHDLDVRVTKQDTDRNTDRDIDRDTDTRPGVFGAAPHHTDHPGGGAQGQGAGGEGGGGMAMGVMRMRPQRCRLLLSELSPCRFISTNYY